MSNNKYKILVVEDDLNICSIIRTVLEGNRYQMLSASTCTMGVTMFESHTPDLVLLDLGLPDRDGTALIRHIRKKATTPIIVLSARTGEQDKVTALDLGANDYVTKPFSTAELLARIRAALRTSRQHRHSDLPENDSFSLGHLQICYGSRLVTLHQKPVSLTQTEYNILALLSQHAGKVLTYTVIIKTIWGYQDPGSIKRLQVNMANIRKKLGIKPGCADYIVNELGVGYRMPAPEESEIFTVS